VPRTRPARSDVDRVIGDAADAYGWLHHRERFPGLTRDGYADGFPQHALLRDGRLVLVTLTPHGERLTPNERPWVERLERSPSVEMYVVSRDDLGELTMVLRRDATPRGPPPSSLTRNDTISTRRGDVRPGQTGRTSEAPTHPTPNRRKHAKNTPESRDTPDR
jgi:hypothetical protein